MIDLLIKKGFKVYVIAPIDKYIHYKEQYHNVKHIPLKRLSRDSVNPIRDLRLTMELKSIYKKLNADIILHYTVKPNIYGGFALRKLKIPSIAIVTGLGYAFIHNNYIKQVMQWLYTYSSKFHNRFIFENIDDRLLFENIGLIAQGQGISVKGCGVDTGYFKPQKSKKKTDKLIFTFIGRLIYDKGVKEFVEAARKVKENSPNVEFWLVGEIDKQNPAAVNNDDLMKWVRDKTVIYHGHTNDVKKFIAQSDCIVLPSYREAIARSITEGMAMEKPVITTLTAGCREAVDEDVNGYLVPIKNVNKLVLAIEKIIQLTDEQRKEMGKAGRIKVLKEFDDRIIANNILNVINEVLNESK